MEAKDFKIGTWYHCICKSAECVLKCKEVKEIIKPKEYDGNLDFHFINPHYCKMSTKFEKGSNCTHCTGRGIKDMIEVDDAFIIALEV